MSVEGYIVRGTAMLVMSLRVERESEADTVSLGVVVFMEPLA